MGLNADRYKGPMRIGKHKLRRIMSSKDRVQQREAWQCAWAVQTKMRHWQHGAVQSTGSVDTGSGSAVQDTASVGQAVQGAGNAGHRHTGSAEHMQGQALRGTGRGELRSTDSAESPHTLELSQDALGAPVLATLSQLQTSCSFSSGALRG